MTSVEEMQTEGYKQLRALFAMAFDGYDAWGSAMGWMFGVADVLYHADPDMVPDAWEFRHGAGCDGNCTDWPDSWLQDELDHGGCTVEDLAAFGNVLDRYADWLRAAGKDY